jgi:hypothetical protein
VEVLDSLRDGDFGPCENETEQYIEACRAKFPYAIAFKPPAEVGEEGQPLDQSLATEPAAPAHDH